MSVNKVKTIKSLVLASVIAFSGVGSFAIAKGEAATEQQQVVATVEGAVNVNTAGIKEIAKALKGVGKRKAKAIVEFREKNGLFKSLEELTQVRGIGKRTLAKNEGKIAL